MPTAMGEYLVGAYLKLIKGCDLVDYNARPPGGGLKGLEELDVIGLNFDTDTAYFCEVTTHIMGGLYGSYENSITKVTEKYARQKDYANTYLKNFSNPVFMFWSPRVSKGYLTENLAKLDGLELIINEEYTKAIDELRVKAKKMGNDTGNPAFRVLQILEHLRR